MQEASKAHLQQLEGSRKLFIAANSLIGAQRQLLYAHDELSMALLRITTRRDGEQVGWGLAAGRGVLLYHIIYHCVGGTSQQGLSN
jgi:hypothetical protein